MEDASSAGCLTTGVTRMFPMLLLAVTIPAHQGWVTCTCELVRGLLPTYTSRPTECLQTQCFPPDPYRSCVPERPRQRVLEANVPQPKHPSTRWRPPDRRSGTLQDHVIQGEGA